MDRKITQNAIAVCIKARIRTIANVRKVTFLIKLVQSVNVILLNPN